MAFSVPSLPLSLGTFKFCHYDLCFYAIGESRWIIMRNIVIKISITDICLIYNTISNILVSNSIVFWGGGGESYSILLNKTLCWGPVAPLLRTPLQSLNLFSRAFHQLKSIGSGICNPLENV